MPDLRFRKDDPSWGEYLFALAITALLVILIAGLWAMAFDDPPPLPEPEGSKPAPVTAQ